MRGREGLGAARQRGLFVMGFARSLHRPAGGYPQMLAVYDADQPCMSVCVSIVVRLFLLHVRQGLASEPHHAAVGATRRHLRVHMGVHACIRTKL